MSCARKIARKVASRSKNSNPPMLDFYCVVSIFCAQLCNLVSARLSLKEGAACSLLSKHLFSLLKYLVRYLNSCLFCSLPPVPDGRSVRTHIHAEFTRRALNSLTPNSLPAVRYLRDKSHTGPLAAGATGRLWCGHSTLVLSYMLRLGLAQDDSCPNCGQGPADTEHVLLHWLLIQQYSITYDIHWSTSGPAQSKRVTSCLYWAWCRGVT